MFLELRRKDYAPGTETYFVNQSIQLKHFSDEGPVTTNAKLHSKFTTKTVYIVASLHATLCRPCNSRHKLFTFAVMSSIIQEHILKLLLSFQSRLPRSTRLPVVEKVWPASYHKSLLSFAVKFRGASDYRLGPYCWRFESKLTFPTGSARTRCLKPAIEHIADTKRAH